MGEIETSIYIKVQGSFSEGVEDSEDWVAESATWHEFSGEQVKVSEKCVAGLDAKESVINFLTEWKGRIANGGSFNRWSGYKMEALTSVNNSRYMLCT